MDEGGGGFNCVFLGMRGGDYCALRCNSYKRFPEPTAACAQGYGGMLEVDLGDPVCPLPVQPAKITVKAMQAGVAGGQAGCPRELRWLCSTCVHILFSGGG